jgi:hypothetical protein
MISRMATVLEQITDSYPLLAPQLSSLTADDASDSRLMAELGSHVVDLLEARRSEEVRPAFGLAERLIASGTEPERHAAIVGFLETVQNVASHRPCGATAFNAFLGPLSQKAWAELDDIWKGKTSLAEVVAAETGARLGPPWWQFWRKRRRRSGRELLEQVENPELRKLLEQITRE